MILNLPGNSDYNPTCPWVYRFNSATGEMANFFGTYIDNIRTGDCHATSCRVASVVGYLGEQDAPRKCHFPNQCPGAWSGAMCFTITGEGLYVTCSQEKWDKGKTIVEDLHQAVVVNDENLLT